MPEAAFTLKLAQPLMLSLFKIRPFMSMICNVADPEPVAGLLMMKLPSL